MTFEILFMLVLMVAALVAFVKEIFPIEVTALGFLSVLVVAGIVSPEDAVSGFSSKAVVAIGGLFVLSHALMKTGVLEVAADQLSERSRQRPWMGIGIMLFCTGILSGFLNNTAMVALAIPLVMKLCSSSPLWGWFFSPVACSMCCCSPIGCCRRQGTADQLRLLLEDQLGQIAAHPVLGREYGGFVLAVRRVGAVLRKKVAHVRLRYTDSMLLLIPEARLDKLRRSEDLVVLSENKVSLSRDRFWWLVFLVLPTVIALAATGVLKISAGVLVGSVLLLLLGVLKPQEAYRSIDWSVVFLIAAFVPVGKAFVSTGTADYIAGGILSAVSWAPSNLAPYVALSLVYLTTSVLTQMVSNNAAAIIVAPIALAIGPSLGVDARPFVLAVCFAASAEFMTPMGYQTNLMVYGAGGYRFLDYTRFGAPLNILFWLLGTLLIPVFWPF